MKVLFSFSVMINDKDVHTMILCFLVSEAKCLNAAREFLMDSPHLIDYKRGLDSGENFEVLSPYLMSAKVTVTQILEAFFKNSKNDNTFGRVTISASSLNMKKRAEQNAPKTPERSRTNSWQVGKCTRFYCTGSFFVKNEQSICTYFNLSIFSNFF